MSKKIKIHFVCRGNVFRSRLAEAYLKSLKGNEWEISSSGTIVNKLPNRSLSPWASHSAKKHGFQEFFSTKSAQTTSKLLSDQDIIIFVRKNAFNEARKLAAFNPAKSLVWNVKDREDWAKKMSIPELRRRTFAHIKRNVDWLVREIEHGGWVDIVDENNTSLNFRLPIRIANKNAQWFRCCHAIITTPSKNTLVQKRSKRIIFSPSLLDVSLGGHVDSGEEPGPAIRREILEETGLKVSQPKLLEIARQSGYHPHYKTRTKIFVYAYHVPIADEDPVLIPEKSEVAEMVFLAPSILRRLIRRHSLKGLGRLNYPYQFYKRNLVRIGQY